MRKKALVVGLLMAGGLAGQAEADEASSDGLYAALRLVPGLANTNNIDRSPLGAGPVVLIDDTIEATIALEAAIGRSYQLTSTGTRLETELAYRYRYHFDIESQSVLNNSVYDSSVKATQSFMLNAWYVVPVSSGWDAKLGGGIGLASQRTKTTRQDLTRTVLDSDETTSTNLAWMVGAGFEFDIGGNWRAETLYRYTDHGDIKIGPFTTGDSLKHGSSYEHQFVFGLKRVF